MYWETAQKFMRELLPDSSTATSSRTESGLIWVLEWNSLQYPMASAFLVLFSDYMIAAQIPTLFCRAKYYEPANLRNFAISQVCNFFQ
uniref:cellulase n=1 Tax=Rhizophora mucronata TaxID=61149 RepID=A0A2P2N0Q0_RHIMU